MHNDLLSDFSIFGHSHGHFLSLNLQILHILKTCQVVKHISSVFFFYHIPLWLFFYDSFSVSVINFISEFVSM